MHAPVLLLPAGGGSDVWGDATAGVMSLLAPLGRLLTVVTGLAAAAVLFMVVLRFMKGDREGASQLAWWLAGLVFALVMLAVLGSVSSSM